MLGLVCGLVGLVVVVGWWLMLLVSWLVGCGWLVGWLLGGGCVSPHAVHTLIYDVVCFDGMRVRLELRANEASSCLAPLLGRPACLSHPQRNTILKPF